jgi:hypothetical protein
MGKRGRKPSLEITARNAEIARLFARGAEVCDLSIRHGLKPGQVANIVRAAGISTRRRKPGPRHVSADPPPRPQLGRSFCRQCDMLRWPAEARACSSRWCALKGTSIRADALPSFGRAGG